MSEVSKPLKPATTNSITVLDNVYFRRDMRNPIRAGTPHCWDLVSDEQPYIREIRIAENWQKLDTGWLQKSSLIMLHNHEGENLQRVPTPEEKEATAKRIVAIGIGHSDLKMETVWIVRPGRNCRGELARLDNVYVRCLSGSALCTLFMFPE